MSSPSPMVLHVGSPSRTGLNVCSLSPTALRVSDSFAFVLVCGLSFAGGTVRGFHVAFVPECGHVLA